MFAYFNTQLLLETVNDEIVSTICSFHIVVFLADVR